MEQDNKTELTVSTPPTRASVGKKLIFRNKIVQWGEYF